MAFLDLVDRSGRIQLQARVDELGADGMERLLGLDLGDLIGVDGVAFSSRRGELTLRVQAFDAAREVAAPAAREASWADRRRDPVSPPRARPDRQRGVARAVHHARARDLGDPAIPRRRGLHRGRDAGAAAAVRRRRRAAVHHPPQRARPRPLPADRDRAVPEAADRRRPRARVRDRQGLPQRGLSTPPTTPSSRCSSGTRRTPTTSTSPSAASGWSRSWPREIGYCRGDRPLAAVAAGDADRGDPVAHRRSTSRGSATATRWPPRCASRGLVGARGRHVAPARRRAALQARRADADRADVPDRLPGRALAVRQAPPLRSAAGRAVRGVRRRDGVRQRLHRAQRPRRAAPALRGPARAGRRRRRGGPALRRGVRRRRSSTGCRRPAGSGSGSTAW